MEAKRKAEELALKISECGEDGGMYVETALKLSNLLVDEIIKATQRETINEQGTGLDIIPQKYWLDVKEEINKLKL